MILNDDIRLIDLTVGQLRALLSEASPRVEERADDDGEMVYVRMDVYVEYDPMEEELTGGHIPVCAECHVKDFDCDTADGSDVDFDEYKLEEMTYDILMQY